MDAYTMGLLLCDDDGILDVDTLNRLRHLTGLPPYEGEPVACTGSAHLAGEHIRCLSSAHTTPVVGTAVNGWQVNTAGYTTETVTVSPCV